MPQILLWSLECYDILKMNPHNFLNMTVEQGVKKELTINDKNIACINVSPWCKDWTGDCIIKQRQKFKHVGIVINGD